MYSTHGQPGNYPNPNYTTAGDGNYSGQQPGVPPFNQNQPYAKPLDNTKTPLQPAMNGYHNHNIPTSNYTQNNQSLSGPRPNMNNQGPPLNTMNQPPNMMPSAPPSTSSYLSNGPVQQMQQLIINQTSMSQANNTPYNSNQNSTLPPSSHAANQFQPGLSNNNPGIPHLQQLPPVSSGFSSPPVPGMPPTSQPPVSSGLQRIPGTQMQPPPGPGGMPPMMPPGQNNMQQSQPSGPGIMPGMPPGPTGMPGQQPGPGNMARMSGSQHMPYGSGQIPGHGMQPPGTGMQPPGQGMQPPGPGMQPSGPGMQPPGPGMQPPGPGMQPPGPGGMPYGGAQPQAQRRLNPDAMPSPIQVTNEDRINRQNEVFTTDGRGKIPPLVTTEFTVNDCGSASPRYIRCSTYSLPATAEMAKTCQVPMAFSVKPLANLPEGEAPPLIVDPGADGPIRCKRCKAYMCPQFKFVEGGRRFQCIICSAITETPPQYFDHVDHLGQRVDRFQRPELCRGSYEFLTTKDYCRNDKFPNVPAFIFAIDVSYNAIKCGMVDLLCHQIKLLLDNLPCDIGMTQSTVKVGFVTYNNTIHFYNLKSTLAQPQVLVVSDVADVFVPLQDGFLVDVRESRHVIDSLLEQIPLMYSDTRETAVVFGPVVQAAVQALQSADCTGKLFMFHSTLPSAEAPGKLKARDDRKLIGTDKEKVLFSPASNFYEKLAKECVAQGLCVDLFLFPNQFIDIATLGQISLLTGGDIYKYNFFRPEVDGIRFINDLKHDMSRNIVFDAILRIRVSTGIRPVEFIGALFMSNTTDVELAAIDCDKALMIEIKHDDKLTEEEGAFMQVALLYTSVGGQRRLRIHNLNLAVSTQLPDLYRSCENDVLVSYLSKIAVKAALTQPSMKIREELIARSAAMLSCYRKHCASPSSPGQLILPECMKLLPVYLNCILKNDAIQSANDIATDERAYLRQLLYSMDVKSTQAYFYPRLTPVMNQKPEEECTLPAAVRCSEEKLDEHGAYLLHNGTSVFLWLGAAISPDWIRSVFGVQSPAQIDIDAATLPIIDNKESNELRDLILILQSDSYRQMKLTIIRQRDKLEGWFKHFLVEDRGRANSASYIDFLCHVHKEVRALLA